MLSLHQLTDSTDMTFCMDNEALFDINQRQLKIAHPNFKDLNRVSRPFWTIFRSLFLKENLYLICRSSLASCVVFRRVCGSQASLTGASPYQWKKKANKTV
jgi:hypothetical protein